MKKLVNGVEVEMTEQEAAAQQAEWDAEAAAALAAAPEAARLAAIDQAIASDALIAQLKGYTNAELSTWFAARTAAQRWEIVERLLRVALRRVL